MRLANNRFHIALPLGVLLVSGEARAAQLATSFEVGLATVNPARASLDLLLVGFRVGSIKPFVPGVDWSIAVAPAAFREGFLLAKSALDLTYPISLGCGAILTPRTGLSALAGVGSGGAGAVAGYNVGVGLVARAGPRWAVRLDITQDWFLGERFTPIVTIGFLWLRSAPPATSPPAPPHASAPCWARHPSLVPHRPVS